MSEFSSFSSYSKRHGNKNDWTGCLISPDDSKKLRAHGLGIGAPIGASGTISTDGTVDLVLSRADDAVSTVRRYDSKGSVCFDVLPKAIQLRSGNRTEELTREPDIHVSKLVVQVRKGVVHLVSTDASRCTPSKKRNASTRVRRVRFHVPQPETSVHQIGEIERDRPLVSYVRKMGDNFALLMSAPILAQAGLAEGSRVEIESVGDGRIIVCRSKRHFTLDELLAGMTPEREHPLEDDTPRGEEAL